MDRYLYEQRLRDEVIYLHSLWHQGPPSAAAAAAAAKRSRPENDNNVSLQQTPNDNKRKKNDNNLSGEPATWATSCGASTTAEKETATPTALDLQRSVLSVFGGTFAESEEDGDGGDAKYQFLLRIFTENSKLRRYYEENSKGGEFCCLVCEKRKNKKFTTCGQLVHHAAMAAKAERCFSHRALVRVVCRVLGWDFDLIPLIVERGEPLGRTLARQAKQLQQKAMKVCQEFLASRSDSGSDESDNEDEEEESDESDSEDEEEDPSEDVDGADGDASKDWESFHFFVNLFMEDSKLRDFYVNNCEDGHFCCLVCGWVDEMVSKSIRGCVALVQHSIVISTANKKLVHRAYGQAICEILGWDFNKFPSTIAKGESLGQILSKLGYAQGLRLNQQLVSSSEWPCEKLVEKSPLPVLEWPPFSSCSASAGSSLSAEEQAKFDALQLQHKAVKAFQDFLKNNSSSNNDECDNEYEDKSASEKSANKDENKSASNNSKEFDFFSKLFMENKILGEFYVKNCKEGELFCLVCGGIGRKVWKRFKGCVPLVQHSTSISKTSKKLAHRAYGKVICQVLGWDFKRFPSDVINSESQSQSSAKLDNLQDCRRKGRSSQ